MRFAYQNGKESGHVEAYSALRAASKVMGTKATHVAGDVYDSATYQGQYRDSDDYDQCILKVDPKPGLTLCGRAAIGVLAAWGLIIVSSGALAVYDINLYKQLATDVLGKGDKVAQVAKP